MKITYELNLKDLNNLTCSIYADGELLEVVPMAQRTERLKELGYDFAAASAKLAKTSSGKYGWGASRSAGIRKVY